MYHFAVVTMSYDYCCWVYSLLLTSYADLPMFFNPHEKNWEIMVNFVMYTSATISAAVWMARQWMPTFQRKMIVTHYLRCWTSKLMIWQWSLSIAWGGTVYVGIPLPGHSLSIASVTVVEMVADNYITKSTSLPNFLMHAEKHGKA